ncbi:PREDICTED: membrane steroid-binding protein 1-like [Camelina sativa]|uniref:Membrane steroid-binding protein 1-like n=1 Tax=Camelina sativa TaxID=90675 RepID=A0ABM0UL39_CAMSA|nr:PREDICTED: membrane steroid-binding protein 1-like [Camelina sativa]
MALHLWQTLKEAIHAYTGLSPVVFFTALALAFAIYQVVSGWFASPFDDVRRHQRARSLAQEEEEPPIPQPVQVGEITEDELKQYDGSDPQKPLLMAIKHQIYDVTQSRMFYGPGGPYALFAGRDASRALAKMSFEEKDLTWDISGLGPFELEALQDWEYKFMSKYAKVGTVIVTGSEPETASVSEPVETGDPDAHETTTPEKTVVEKSDEAPAESDLKKE